MENKKLFSQGTVSSETTNEAQPQTYVQPSTKFESQEEENMNLLPAICFLEQNFQFRHNVLSGMVEYKKNGENDIPFHPLTNAGLNTLIIKAKVDMPEEANLKSDIKTYLESDMIPLHDPVKEYLANLPKWDGVDRIADFWKRIPNLSDEKIEFLHIWHLSTVVHWMGKDEEHGNETVPLFIGNQGCGKSTFCLHILPPQLRCYYLDHFNLGNKFDKEMALSNSLIICLDEIDQYKKGQIAELKQALSKVSVNSRKIYGRTIDHRQRYASFIATTNNRHPLMDKTGSRRYLTIGIPDGEFVDYKSAIEYDQLFAQLKHEIEVEQKRYWFTNDEIARIQELNTPFEATIDLEHMISSFFHKPENGEKCEGVTSMDIRKSLSLEYPEVPASNFSSIKIGLALKELKVKKMRSKRGITYSLIKTAA